MADASEIAERFVSRYNGLFGTFSMSEGSGTDSATAVSPDGDRESSVRFEIPDDIKAAFDKRKKFVDSKRRKLIPMGKLVPFETLASADECYGGILNYHLMGRTGGFFFYVARRGGVLITIQAYCTSKEVNIPDDERDRLISIACDCAE